MNDLEHSRSFKLKIEPYPRGVTSRRSLIRELLEAIRTGRHGQRYHGSQFRKKHQSCFGYAARACGLVPETTTGYWSIGAGYWIPGPDTYQRLEDYIVLLVKERQGQQQDLKESA